MGSPKQWNSMTMSELDYRKALVSTGWAISLLLCAYGLRKQSSVLVGALCFLFQSVHGHTVCTA